jgi:cold shock protein
MGGRPFVFDTERRMETGTVTAVLLSKGYGFIKPAGGGKDLFFHAQQIADDLAFDERLREMRVQYNVVETDKGPRAVGVRAAE